MNANSGEAPKFELPPLPVEYEAGQDKSPESLPSRQESSVGKQAPPPSLPQPVPVNLTAPAQTAPPSAPTNSQDSASDETNLSAAEVDRIEKEWIDRAKAVVAKTKDDPFEQNSEMSKVKADYIKKRFDKTIPTDGTVPA